MNPFLGVLFHWLGGLASGSFYVPYKGVKRWSWETYWLVGGVFSWIVCPWLLALTMTHDLFEVLRQQSRSTLWWTYFFGAMWGFGGLTFGLTMRYLGMSLGMGVALGYCAAFGTLVPPIAKSLAPGIPVESSLGDIVRSHAGLVTLAGVVVCLLGILVAALAGWTKEREMPEAAKRKAIAEFHFTKGLLVATFSGIMSACFAFALTAGNPIGEASKAAGTSVYWTGLPKLVVVLLGGFTTNCVWCVILNLRNRSGYQYLASHVRPEHAGSNATGREPGRATEDAGAGDGTALGEPVPVGRGSAEPLERRGTRPGSTESRPTGASAQEQSRWEQAASPERSAARRDEFRVPRLRNYLLSALAGTTWYFQFFFYTMGETQMGKFGFASWTLHMASIIIFSTMWGWILREWQGSSKKAHRLIAAGIALLILSTIIIGYGTYLKGNEKAPTPVTTSERAQRRPPGFGVRQPSAAVAPARTRQERQRTAALQDAAATVGHHSPGAPATTEQGGPAPRAAKPTA